MTTKAHNRQKVSLWLADVPATPEEYHDAAKSMLPQVPGTPEPKAMDDKTFDCSDELAGIQFSVRPPSEPAQELAKSDKNEAVQAEEQPGADYSQYRDNAKDEDSDTSASCITFECSEDERMYKLWCVCEDSDAAKEEKEAAAYDLAEAAWGLESEFWKCNTKNDASGRKVI
jgi:hypothetical protein